MTNDAPTSPAQPSPEKKIQDRADILESNLYNAISKQENPVTLQFQIDRTSTSNPVIVKALVQLFPRLNINIPQILVLIRRLLDQKIPEGRELKIAKQVLSLAGKGPPDLAHLGITLRAFATRDRLAVEIKGVPPVPPRDGAIEEAFFDYESCPGAFKEDGSIDFREINRYPIVRAGDNLFFITPEIQGRPGMQYDGGIIHIPEARPLTIALNGGVDQVESMTREERSKGYFLRASKTGAVLLTKSDGKIAAIEIRDSLDVNRLDYSVGNIGTHFICPISMKIDTICNDFRIRARGTVEVGALEGGHIETESSATVHNAHPGSNVQSEKDAVVHYSRGSTLSSRNGFITITDEALDSRMDARGIAFDKYKGVFTGNTLDAEQFALKNISIGGTNTIHFGRRLFRQKDDLMQARAELKKEAETRKENQARLMEKLQDNIRALSRILKTNPLLRDNLRTLILAAQAMNYPTLHQELEVIGQTMNTKEVDFIRKSLDLLKKMPEAEDAALKKDRALVKRIAQAEHDMDKMTLSIEGMLRRAATIRIFTPDPAKEDPDRPDLFVENQNEKDTFVKLEGSYHRHKGFTLTRQ